MIVLASVSSASAETVTVHPRRAHEECLELKAGDVLSYDFTAPRRLDFNIHFHEGGDVVYMVRQNKTISRTGEIEAPKDQEYCLMWTNSSIGDATLQYEYTVKRR